MEKDSNEEIAELEKRIALLKKWDSAEVIIAYRADAENIPLRGYEHDECYECEICGHNNWYKTVFFYGVKEVELHKIDDAYYIDKDIDSKYTLIDGAFSFEGDSKHIPLYGNRNEVEETAKRLNDRQIDDLGYTISALQEEIDRAHELIIKMSK